MRYFFLLLTIVFVLPTTGIAQWEVVNTTLPSRLESSGTAIAYKDGDLWAGDLRLLFSSDNGDTWEDRTPPDKSFASIIVDIDFFDRNIGMVTFRLSSSSEHVYYTTDRGLTWSKSLHPYPAGATFLSSPEKIVAHGSSLEVSHDAGATWTEQTITGHAMSSVYLGNSKVAVFVAMPANQSQLYLSTDDGLTWTVKPGTTDYDCYDMVYDSCSKVLFVPNEEWWVNEDGVAEAIITTDEGTSWTTVCNFPLTSLKPQLTGGVAITSRAIYAQSGERGVLRSVDKGRTWQEIGGPNGVVDARSIAVANDDLIFAMAEDGSIWRTRNAGGFPLNPVASGADNVVLSLDPLFQDSIIRVCGKPIVEDVPMEVMMCSPVSISSITIEGEGSASYRLEDTLHGPIHGSQNIRVLFTPTQNGHHDAVLRIQYGDGTFHSIVLSGTAEITPIQVTASMSDVVIDTLGEAAMIELHVEPARLDEDVTVHVSYDPSLTYMHTLSKGSVLHSGPSSGSFSFVIPASQLQGDKEDAIIVFDNVTALPKTHYEVRLDSLVVSSPSKECFEISSITIAEINVPVACGTTALSRAIRNENIIINVNQYRENKVLELSATHRGYYAITLVDMLGNIVMSESSNIDPERPASISYRGLSSGTYLVVVRGNGIVSSHRVQM